MTATILTLEKQHAQFYAPRYLIRVGGQDVLRAGAEVVSVAVDEELAGAARCTFTVLNGGLKWLNTTLFTVGAEVEVALGYKEPLETLFLGEISEIKPTFPADGASQLEIAGHDFSHRMSRGCRFQSWENITDADVAREIAGRHGLSPAGVQDTQVVRPKIKQNGENDLEFLNLRAQENHFELAVRGRTLYFAPPQDQSSAAIVAKLKWGESLISFAPELNTANQSSEVTVRGWNPSTKKEIVGRAMWSDVWGNQPGRLSGGQIVEQLYGKVEQCVRDEPIHTQEEADRRAQAVLRTQGNQLITGSGECVGLPIIRARTALELEGLGPFSMRYYVTAVTHALTNSGYRTTFTVRSDTYTSGSGT